MALMLWYGCLVRSGATQKDMPGIKISNHARIQKWENRLHFSWDVSYILGLSQSIMLRSVKIESMETLCWLSFIITLLARVDQSYQYSALPIYRGIFSPSSSRKTPIAPPLGRGVGVFREMLV